MQAVLRRGVDEAFQRYGLGPRLWAGAPLDRCIGEPFERRDEPCNLTTGCRKNRAVHIGHGNGGVTVGRVVPPRHRERWMSEGQVIEITADLSFAGACFWVVRHVCGYERVRCRRDDGPAI